MLYASFTLPSAVAIAGLAHVLIHFSGNILAGELFLLALSLISARFLYRRSKNREAVFFYARVSPSDEQGTNDLRDGVAMLMAGAFVLAAIFLPYL